jgi:hypothetical protein
MSLRGAAATRQSQHARLSYKIAALSLAMTYYYER